MNFLLKVRLIFFILVLASGISVFGAPKNVEVNISWKNKNFDPEVRLFEVTSERKKFISETAIVTGLKDAPIATEIKASVKMAVPSSYPLVMVVENKGDKDLYFFAVPHEMHPSNASAGHFFECLCIGRVYKVPPKSFWYRIVRINLDSSFQNLKQFNIEHQIIGLTEAEVNSTYKDRLYNYK